MISIHSSPRPLPIEGGALTAAPGAIPNSVAKEDVQGRMLAAADALSLLFAMQCSQNNSQSMDREDAIQDQAKQIQECIQAAHEAAERAREAAEDKGFWDDVCSVLDTIADVATVVAGAASIAATGGMSTIAVVALAAALISANADKIADVTGAGEDFAKALKYIGAGVSLATGVGAALEAGAAARTVAEGTAETAKTVRVASLAVGAGATVVKGYATYRSGSYEGDRIDSEANGVAARAREREAQREVSDLVDGLKEINRSFHSAKQSILDAQQNQGDSLMAAINIGRFA